MDVGWGVGRDDWQEELEEPKAPENKKKIKYIFIHLYIYLYIPIMHVSPREAESSSKKQLTLRHTDPERVQHTQAVPILTTPPPQGKMVKKRPSWMTYTPGCGSTPVISAPERWRREDQGFKGSLSYTVKFETSLGYMRPRPKSFKKKKKSSS